MTRVLVVGATRRADAWFQALREARNCDEARRVDADPAALCSALQTSPEARVAIAAGGNRSAWLASVAAELGARGVVEPGAGGRVPAGFLRAADFDAIPAVTWLAQRTGGAAEFGVELHGAADGCAESLGEVIESTLVLLERLLPNARLAAIRLERDSHASLEIAATGFSRIQCAAHLHGGHLRLWMATAETRVDISVDGEREVRVLSNREGKHSHETRLLPSAARALAPLFSEVSTAPTRLVEIAQRRFPPLPPAASSLAWLRTQAERDDPTVLGPHLRGSGTEFSSPGRAEVHRVDDDLSILRDDDGAARELELLAFEHGLKPAVLLPVNEARGGALCERFAHSRVVASRGGLLWFAARDAPSLERLIELRLTPDPDRVLEPLGALLGYPPCCVASFAKQSRRDDDAYSQHVTAACTPAQGPWHWELNDTFIRIVPFFACSYACDAARREARSVLSLLKETAPAAARELESALQAPVFFIDRDAWLRVRGGSNRRVELPRRAPPWLESLARAFARPGEVDARTPRADGGNGYVDNRVPLGVWLPFSG